MPEHEVLEKMNLKDLKHLASDMDIPMKSTITKKDLISRILACFVEYKDYKKKTRDKYKIIKQIGNVGKEGTTYLVEDTITGKRYAMKTFKKTKSESRLKKEVELQKLAASAGCAPIVFEYSTVFKYIVMDLMDEHLLEVISRQKGILTNKQQKQLISLYTGLDKAKVFHADSNMLNYMYTGDKIKIIDYGMSKPIDARLIKALGTDKPNIHYMTLGFILKMRNMNYDVTKLELMLNVLNADTKEKFNLL